MNFYILCFVFLTETIIGCRRISEVGSFQLVHALQNDAPCDAPDPVETGSFVVVRVNSKKYAGLLTDVDLQEQEAEVSLLRPYLPAETFHWPASLASMAIPLPHVLCKVDLSELPDNKYAFTEADRNLLLSKKIIRPKRN